MRAYDSGSVRTRTVVLQLLIVAGLVGFYKLYIPRMQRKKATAEAQERELRIETFFQSAVADDASLEVEVPAASGGGRAHPQRLRGTPPIAEVEQALGAPDERSTDFRGGLHLGWVGTAHKLEAAFDRGRLYCLRREDRRTGHGALVFESSSAWHPF
jgi:hypothetical protein